jgi:hypothetical protein
VQQLRGTDDVASERLPDGLVAQAHAEQGPLAADLAHHLDADAGVGGRSRPGAEQDAVVGERLGGGHLVVAPHVDLRPELGQVLHDVEHERVVVVDDEDAGAHALIVPLPAALLRRRASWPGSRGRPPRPEASWSRAV